MASVQITERTVIVEPLHLDVATELEYGPLPAVRWDRVEITFAKIAQYGFTPPQVGMDWNCYLFLRQVADGTNGAWDMSAFTDLVFSYWRPGTTSPVYTMAATIQSPASAGKVALVSQSTESLVAGSYSFALTANIAVNVPAVLCQGTLEILAAVPS